MRSFKAKYQGFAEKFQYFKKLLKLIIQKKYILVCSMMD